MALLLNLCALEEWITSMRSLALLPHHPELLLKACFRLSKWRWGGLTGYLHFDSPGERHNDSSATPNAGRTAQPKSFNCQKSVGHWKDKEKSTQQAPRCEHLHLKCMWLWYDGLFIASSSARFGENLYDLQIATRTWATMTCCMNDWLVWI